MRQALIRWLMKLRERRIVYDAEEGAIFRELFDHPSFKSLDQAAQMAFGLKWAEKLYEVEKQHPMMDQLGNVDLASRFRGAMMLDIGCYVGGKTIAWLERYHGLAIHGIDIDQRFTDIASGFAQKRGANASFRVAFAEDLPYPNDFFDVIITENTFEHVQDIRQALAECSRTLKKGGFLVAIFPPFWGPFNHHLDLVSQTPFLHWFFSYPALLKAYNSILSERGAEADWYRRKNEKPLPFERGYSINGTGAAAFHRMIKQEWEIVADGYRVPVKGGNPAIRAAKNALKASGLGFGRELFQVSYVLRKR